MLFQWLFAWPLPVCMTNSFSISVYIWLVVYLPLWQIWVRQLGWWHSQYMESHNPFMFQTTNHKWKPQKTEQLWSHGPPNLYLSGHFSPIISSSLMKISPCRCWTHHFFVSMDKGKSTRDHGFFHEISHLPIHFLWPKSSPTISSFDGRAPHYQRSAWSSPQEAPGKRTNRCHRWSGHMVWRHNFDYMIFMACSIHSFLFV